MFSILTIDASTTIPIAKASPASEITLIDKPRPEIATKVPTTETGIAINMIAVGTIDLKNKIRIPIAKHPPIQIFCLTRFIAEAIYFVSSKITLSSRFLSFNTLVLRFLISSFIFCIVVTTFVPCSLRTLKIIAFSPFNRLKLDLF